MSRNSPRYKLSRVPVKQRRQISTTEKVHRISYTRKHTERFNGLHNSEYREDTVLISQSQQKIIFTSTQEEADTRIAIHCTECSKPVLVKAKYTDILILMVCVFALTSPPYG